MARLRSPVVARPPGLALEDHRGSQQVAGVDSDARLGVGAELVVAQLHDTGCRWLPARG